jgi:hypothetical protein
MYTISVSEELNARGEPSRAAHRSNDNEVDSIRSLVLRALLVIVCSMSLIAPAIASSDGPPGENLEQDATVDFGCTCHGGAISSPTVIVKISGVPQAYEAGQTYNFTISLSHESNAEGGFLLTDRGSGSFTVIEEEGVREAPGDSDSVSHSTLGNDWLVPWTAPLSDVGDVHFSLVGNAVNGANGADEGDAWNILTFSIASPGTATVSDGEELSLRTISVGDYDNLFKQEEDAEALEAARQEEMSHQYFKFGNLYYWSTLSILIIAAVVQGEFYERRFGGGPEHLDLRLAVPQGIRRGLLFIGLSYFFFWTLDSGKEYGWPLVTGMLALWAGYGVYRTYSQAKAPAKLEDML